LGTPSTGIKRETAAISGESVEVEADGVDRQDLVEQKSMDLTRV
jgi:hypothetical protein